MKILVLLALTSLVLPPSLCAPFRDEVPDVLDEADGVHNHSDPYRGARLFQNNEFGLGDIDVSGQIEGGDVLIGSQVDIDVGASHSEAIVEKRGQSVASPTDMEEPYEPEGYLEGHPVLTEENDSCPSLKDAPVTLMPKGPQGPAGATLHYDLLSNSQADLNYPDGEHLGAFVAATTYFPPNGEKQIYVPSAAQQDPGTNVITITAEKYEGTESPKITSASLDTKGVWTTAQSREIKTRGYLEVRALMPAKTNSSTLIGANPAIRLLGADGEQGSDNGEINMDVRNGDPTLYMTLRSPNHPSDGQQPPNNKFDFHTDMTNIPVILGMEWNVQADDEKIDLTWWITSFDVPSQMWKSYNTTKSLVKSEGDDNDYSVFFKSFSGSGFYLQINLAQGGHFADVHDPTYLLEDGPQHFVIESFKIYRIQEAVKKQEFGPEAVPMKNIGYLFRGYDIMRGNPLDVNDDIDPGYGQPIFDDKYLGKTTPDKRYLLPEGTSIQDCSGTCTLNFDTKEISGASSYQKSLEVRAKISGGGRYGLFEGKFSASAGYKEVAHGTSSGSSRFTQASAECCSYLAQILTYTKPPLSKNFIAALKTLPDKYEEYRYFEFIETFGTHYVREAKLGSLFGLQSEFSKKAWTNMKENKVDIAGGAKASAYGFTASASFMSSEQKKKNQAFSSFTTKQELFTKGAAPPDDNKIGTWVRSSKLAPAPMMIKLSSIQELLSHPDSVATSSVKSNVKKALDNYCKELVNRGEITSCSAPGPDPSFPKSGKLWRDDGRCGKNFPLSNGAPGQCNPKGRRLLGKPWGPCCSSGGWCGDSHAHCKCTRCVDYRFKGKLWRDDGRCGKNFPLASGAPGQCNPKGRIHLGKPWGPCCSSGGWCGDSRAHCKCASCVDYS